MLLIYPLFVGFWGYTRLTASKFAFFACFTGGWLIALIVSIVKNRIHLGKASFLQSCILLFVLACCISAVVSPNFTSTIIGKGRFDGLLTIFLSASVFMGVSTFSRPKHSYVTALAISMSLCCVIAVIQLFGYNFLNLFPNNYNYYDGGYEFSGEFLGTIGNAGLFSAFLCLCLPLFSAYYITSSAQTPWLLPIIFLGMFCAFECNISAGKLALCLYFIVSTPLLISNSKRLRRGLELMAITCLSICAVLALCFVYDGTVLTVTYVFSPLCAALLTVAVLALILRIILKNRKIAAKALHIGFASITVLIIISCLIILWNWKGTNGTIYEFSRLIHGEVDDSFGSSRIIIWRNTLDLVKERPLFGGGPGTLPLRLEVDFSRYVESSGKTLRASVDNAHNVYLGILANTGALSLILYLSSMVASLALAIKRQSSAILCLTSALLCYWIQDFFGLGLFIVSPLMWMLWGLLNSAVIDDIRLRV